MSPLMHLCLPKLTKPLVEDLIELANGIEDHISKNTIGEIEHNAKLHNDKEVLNELQALKDMYGFDYLPQHRGKRLDHHMSDMIRKDLQITLPYKADFVIQLINTENTFIHNDGTRTCSFYYMISNDTATTSFYESDKDPIYGTVWNPADVIKTNTYTMKQDNWYMFNHNAIHSVNNVTTNRVGMLIDMSRCFNNYNQCVKHFEELYAKTI